MPADPTQTEWTVGRLLQWTTQWFDQKQVEGGRLAAELLLAHAMNCRKIELYTRFAEVPDEEARATFRELAKKAGEHTPIAYLLGRREFYTLDFEVTPAVLIPRPETEALVQRIIEFAAAHPDRTLEIADIGTGSACIAVAVARFSANTRILATDISAAALDVARRNAEKHSLSDRIQLAEADGPDLPAALIPKGGFDLVASNPPYIAEGVWTDLPPHIRDHEPAVALTGSAPGDGLEMYRRFAAEMPRLLRPGGRLLFEIGHDQRESVEVLFAAAGAWEFVAAHRDPTDPYDRVLEWRHGD